MEPIALAPWLEHLRAHLPVARAGSDPEGVHQVRVGAGHLDVWLELAGMRVLRDDLAWLRSGAGRVRELDVLIATGPEPDWRRWIEERRQAERERLVALLDDRRLDGLLEALSLLPPLEGERARARLPKLARRAERRGERMLADPSDIDGFHRLRKGLRRLRYAREWLGLEVRALKSTQQSLGALHDVSVALELFQEWPGRESSPGVRELLLERLEKLRARSLALWKRQVARAEVRP